MLILVLAVVLKPIFPLVDYAVNYNYIAKVLCVNKTKPTLKCNGKCHLMKELAKAAESDNINDKSASSGKKDASKQEVENWYCQDFTSLSAKPVLIDRNAVVFDSYQNLYYILPITAVFHPPTLS